jgi:hypothetical protein
MEPKIFNADLEGVEDMSQDHFILRRVKVLDGFGLALEYADGEKLEVAISPIAGRFKLLKLLLDKKVLKTAAIEQSGQYSHEFLWNWMHKHSFKLDAAADALDLSRPMIAYYRNGEKPLPMTVALAATATMRSR